MRYLLCVSHVSVSRKPWKKKRSTDVPCSCLSGSVPFGCGEAQVCLCWVILTETNCFGVFLDLLESFLPYTWPLVVQVPWQPPLSSRCWPGSAQTGRATAVTPAECRADCLLKLLGPCTGKCLTRGCRRLFLLFFSFPVILEENMKELCATFKNQG